MSTPQSVLDALADAETLALVVRELRTFEYTRARKTAAGRKAEAIGGALFEAAMSGGSAKFQMTTRETWAADGFEIGRLAAKDGFRAVPGLRGDTA